MIRLFRKGDSFFVIRHLQHSGARARFDLIHL